MVGFDGVRRGRAVAVGVAAAMLGGALLAPRAEADDGTAPLAELTAPASEAVEAASEMLATVPVDIEVIEGESPALVEDAHPSEEAASEATPPVDTAASEPETGDTSADHDDTSVDTGSETTPALAPATTAAASSTTPQSPQPPSAPEAAAPANVNISIRIDSAGDDGPVTQVNVSVAPSPADGGTSRTAAEPARPTASGTAAPPAVTDTSAGESETSVVDWIWRCLGLRAISATVSPTEPSTDHDTQRSSPTWNCGDNGATSMFGDIQYRPEIAAQYRAINMNVSIRVSSPGDNGPVSQTNVMVALGIGGQVAPASERAAGAAAIAVHAEGPVVTVTFAASTTPAVAEAAPVDVISLPIPEDATLEQLPAGVHPRPASIVFLESDASALRPADGQRRAMHVVVPIPGVASLHAPRVAFGPESRSTEVRDRASRSAPAGRRTRTGPPRASAPGKSIVLLGSAPGGASVAPASGGSPSSGGLPVFLLFPFIAVMLDLARRVVATCLTWPSGHRARMPDTPG